ncbi:centrosomal protein of 76 kDa-like isoform X2 [Pomacea canaliculata]|nr:centrosomal protein of 76 kDa-like isoform X2 [Pomacea canaliculata]
MAPPVGELESPSHPYITIGCVFNHQSFYANCQFPQPSDRVEECHFDLQNKSLWKSMASELLVSVCCNPLWSSPLPLCASSIDPPVVSNDLEVQLRRLVAQHRQDQGLTTQWDDQLSYILTPALAARETEMVTGVADNKEYQDAVQQAMPEGHHFNAKCIHANHTKACKIFQNCLMTSVSEIINCKGDPIQLAVRENKDLQGNSW